MNLQSADIVDLCEILGQVFSPAHEMMSGAQTSYVSYTGPLLPQVISVVICCSLHIVPSVLAV